MTQYIGIIRGINVGGHNKVNMKELRDVMTKHKYQDVRTYIQSGNIVFRSGLTSVGAIEKSLSNLLKSTFEVNVPVLVRDEKEWKRTIKRNPFLERTEDFTKLLVTFLSEKPSPELVKATSLINFPHDVFTIDGKDIYLYCMDGYGKCDVPNNFFEKQLKVKGTTRNWKTVLELGEITAGS